MIAAYVRVSSRAQDCATQRAAILRAASGRVQQIDRWFEEHRSAGKLKRPELDAVRELVRQGQIHTLYVFRLDRLSRSGIRDTLAVVEELRSAGCRLINVADGFDVGEPALAGDIVIAVLAWAAQMERAAIGERISAARVRVEASGGNWGRPQRCDGYIERRIHELRAAGLTVRQISAATKVPKSTVANVLSKKPPPDWAAGRRKKSA